MLSLVEKIVFVIVLMGSLSWFVQRGRLLVALVNLGADDPDERRDNPGGRLVEVLLDALLQRKTLRKPWVGVLHLLIVWGFLIFAINTINHFVGGVFGGFNMLGHGGLASAYALVSDIFAVLVLVGVIGLAYRRFVVKPESLTAGSVESAVVFLFIGGAMVAHLVYVGVEIVTGTSAHTNAHVVSALVAGAFGGLGEGALTVLMRVAWWSSALMHLVLIGLLVYPTKHQHLVAGPIKLFFKRTRHRGNLKMMDLEDEEAETFGVSKLQDFTQMQLLDHYACIECGRCNDFCPTHNSGKALHPKSLIHDIRGHLLADGPKLLKAKAEEEVEVPALIGEVVSLESLWACTTCGACVEHCPMGIEHVDKITDMRRHQVLMEGAFPEQAQNAFRGMETAANPWSLPQAERGAWAEGLEVPTMAEKQEVDILYWVGCSGSYDDRNKKVSQALVQILKAAEVDFAILGEEERCTCESARRLGNEMLFQMASMEITEVLKQYKFNRILVQCPHCLNTLANEHPDFGGEYEVVHHTDYINELIRDKRLQLYGGQQQTTALHDSCYLARYNDVVTAPREVLRHAANEVQAVAREGKSGYCCGAGGGRMWLEETEGEAINQQRAGELLATGAKQVGTACPFCMTMLSDGVKNQGADVPVLDVAEIVAGRLGG